MIKTPYKSQKPDVLLIKNLSVESFETKENDKEFHKLWVLLQGKFLFKVNKLPDKTKVSWDNYTKLNILGKGGFGMVYLVKDNSNGKYAALKLIKKSIVLQTKIVDLTINEKHILSICEFPFILGYLNSFQTNSYLCLVLELAPGGDLYKIIATEKPLPSQIIKCYSAQILLALQYLKSVSIIHRDIKPQNILIAKNGYIKVADFGMSKILRTPYTNTVSGTIRYMAPEVFNGKGYNTSVDWWAFGCVIYEMFEGVTPFYNKEEAVVITNIKKRKLSFSSNFSVIAKNLISRLLFPDPLQRLGCSVADHNEPRNHIFFESIEWLELYYQKVPAPFKPNFPNYSEITPIKGIEVIPNEDDSMKYKNIFECF